MHRVARPGRVAAAVLAVVAGLVVGASGPAHADNFGNVNCDLNPTAPECTASVRSLDEDRSSTENSGSSSSALVCTFQGEVVDCVNELGWYGGDGCYYSRDASNYTGGLLGPDEWVKSCLDPSTGDVFTISVVVLPQSPVTVDMVLHSAMSRLRMPAPVIAASPALTAPQVVHVPVWWRIQSDVWQPRSATAAVPGIALTVTATPQRITWDAGDGTTTVCTGPGTL